MSFRPRSLVLPLVVLALAGAAFFWWREYSHPQPVTFRTVTVTRGTLTQTVTASGGLQPVETVEVSSQISGLITEVAVDFNTRVKAGDVLARLDPASYETRLRSSEAEYANTAANHRLISLNAERIRSLHERNLVSQQELDQSIAQLAQADAQLQIRRAAVETAKVDLARCIITAPIDGIVLDRPAIAGKTVSASTSAPVLFVLVNDLRQMQIVASVSEADISNIRENQTANFTVDAYPGQAFRGSVRQIRNNPTREQNVVSYATVISVNNDDLRLKPGMTADVAIVVQERENVLLLANAALRARVPDDIILPAAEVAADPTAPDSAALEPRRSRRSRSPEAGAETTRTVHLPAGTPAAPRAQAITVRFGITDGIDTEVIAGLEENAEVIVSVIDAAELAAAPAASPFGSPPRR